MTTTLRQFVEQCSALVDHLFNHTGRIAAMYHVVTRGGDMVLMPPPSNDKDISVIITREIFKQKDIVRYVFMDEAWIMEVSKEEDLLSNLSRHPRRKEIVILSAEDELEGQIMARRDINRPAGKKPYLGPLIIEEKWSIMEGRLVGLLAQRGKLQ